MVLRNRHGGGSRKNEITIKYIAKENTTMFSRSFNIFFYRPFRSLYIKRNLRGAEKNFWGVLWGESRGDRPASDGLFRFRRKSTRGLPGKNTDKTKLFPGGLACGWAVWEKLDAQRLPPPRYVGGLGGFTRPIGRASPSRPAGYQRANIGALATPMEKVSIPRGMDRAKKNLPQLKVFFVSILLNVKTVCQSLATENCWATSDFRIERS